MGIKKHYHNNKNQEAFTLGVKGRGDRFGT